MILYFSVENFRSFRNKVEINFEADMRIKRFACNTIETSGTNVLKTLGVYGPNNTGKTSILLALLALKNVMTFNAPYDSYFNYFNTGNHDTKFVVKYIINKQIYEYNVIYNSYDHHYVSEELYELKIDPNNKSQVSRTNVFVRNDDQTVVDGQKMITNRGISTLSNSLPLMMAFNFNTEHLNKVKNDYIKFANSIMLLRMDGLFQIDKTIDLLAHNEKAKEFINEFVRNCDLNISNVGYSEEIYVNDEIRNDFNRYVSGQNNKELLKIYSEHNGVKVPSILIDSLGTDKIIAMAGYIYEALHDGKILVIDEIDSSLHHILTRSIVSMFNNMLNEHSQLLFSTHDALLMDIKHLLRKDQIYLTDYDEVNKASNIISFAKEFTSKDDVSIRGYEDISTYYLNGKFGCIPSADLFESLEKAIED